MISLKEITEADFDTIAGIYNYYIENSTATFHTEFVSGEQLRSVIPCGHPKYKSFLLEHAGKVCGYCYLGQYKNRPAYDRTAEITIYLKPECFGKGIAQETLKRLENLAVETNIYVLVGIITGENHASIKLFERMGYEKCAHFKQVGEKFGRVLDVVAYQKILID